MNFPTSIKSHSTNPRVVKAQVPILIPPGFKADLSPNTEFLFIDISTLSQTYSNLLPLIPLFFKFISRR